MLDPFTALSLAGNIVQFVNFGYQILNKSFVIFNSGTNEGNKQLEVITTDLSSLSGRIDAGALLFTGPASSLSVEDEVSPIFLLTHC